MAEQQKKERGVSVRFEARVPAWLPIVLTGVISTGVLTLAYALLTRKSRVLARAAK